MVGKDGQVICPPVLVHRNNLFLGSRILVKSKITSRKEEGGCRCPQSASRGLGFVLWDVLQGEDVMGLYVSGYQGLSGSTSGGCLV